MNSPKNPVPDHEHSLVPPPPSSERLGVSSINQSLSLSQAETFYRLNLRYNLAMNLLDGAFFGAALGFASFVTVIPLFVSQLTSSAVLIGLIPAIHTMGWQLPQLLTAPRVARQSLLRPMVIMLTLHERIPFLVLAILAYFLLQVGQARALTLTFLLLVWQGLGGGFSATAWQSMIAKIIPARRRGTFYGAQSALANLFASISAVIAGLILEARQYPLNYALCFLLASISMGVSWLFLARTREIPVALPPLPDNPGQFRRRVREILQQDAKFRWFLLVRMLSQFAVMAFAFYTVFAVQKLGIGESSAGVMTSLYLGAQIVTNPLMGWVGDRWGHRTPFQLGMLAAVVSTLIAWGQPSLAGFYAAFILAGIANAAVWTTSLAMTLEFGSEADRPAYIGLANTLTTPATILAPFVGGWLADWSGYSATFFLSAGMAALTTLILKGMASPPRSGYTSENG